MALQTIKQRQAAAALEAEYGRADQYLIEHNEDREPLGVVRLVWFRGFHQPRILDIKPDGTRRTYDDARV